MSSLAELQSVARQNGIEGNIARVMADISQLFEDGFVALEQRLIADSLPAPEPVNQIFSHILEAGGKRIRPAVCMVSARAIRRDAPVPLDLAMVCELLHSATLLHDDVIDEGDLRRGQPAARKVWSNALSVLGGDYMLMRCVEIMTGFGQPYSALFVETLKALVEGEIIQLRHRESIDTTEDDYFAIVNGKTSSLFRFSASSGAMAAGASAADALAFGQYGQHIGAAFQIIDDVLDFSCDSALLGKDLLSDISQGKMTLPLIVAAQRDAEVKELLRQLIKDGEGSSLASEIAAKTAQSGALEYARQRAASFTQAGIAALSSVNGADSSTVQLLKDLASALLMRNR